MKAQKPSFCLSLNPHWFLQPEVMGISLLGTETLGWGAWYGTETPRFSVGELCSQDILPNETRKVGVYAACSYQNQ